MNVIILSDRIQYVDIGSSSTFILYCYSFLKIYYIQQFLDQYSDLKFKSPLNCADLFEEHVMRGEYSTHYSSNTVLSWRRMISTDGNQYS